MTFTQGELEVIGEFVRRQQSLKPAWCKIIGMDIESNLFTIHFSEDSGLKPFLIKKIYDGHWDFFLPGYQVSFMRDYQLCEEAMHIGEATV